MGGKGAALLVALLVTASVLAAIPSCSADANNTTNLPIEPKASPPAPGHTSSSLAVVFPLEGNVHPIGKYYVQMSFGVPPKSYSMDIDTGSDVTWIQCEIPTKELYPRPPADKMIPCNDPLCKAVHDSTGIKKCTSPNRCDYQIQYVDSSAVGVLISDDFTFVLTDGATIEFPVAFGCGEWRGNKDNQMLTDGMLGLGFGEISILSQLTRVKLFKNFMGHCLDSKGGGSFFVGDDGRLPQSGLSWAPMFRSHHYSPGPATLFWENQHIGSRLEVVLLDSGSTFTYIGLHAYNNIISSLNDHVSTQPLRRASDDHSLPYCWSGPNRFRSIADAQQYFKNLVLAFAGGGALMRLTPVNYLIISIKGNACLGILNGTEIGLQPNLNIIGDISLLDRLVIYDNEEKRIGWVSTDCSKLFPVG